MNFQKLYLRLTYDLWRRILPKYALLDKGLRILECGTGSGYLMGFLEKWFHQCNFYGLDIESKVIHQAKENGIRANLLLASAEEMPFPDQAFDVVISLHMVEHLKEPQRFFEEAYRVMRPGGLLAFATPNPEGIGSRVMKKNWSSWRPEHISLHPPEVWRAILLEKGFSVLKDGTTGLSGIPAFRKFPLGLLNRGMLFLFGFFPWRHGEAYVSISRKEVS